MEALCEQCGGEGYIIDERSRPVTGKGLLIVGLMLAACALGIYGAHERMRADHLQKLLTKTVEACAEAWLAAPIKTK